MASDDVFQSTLGESVVSVGDLDPSRSFASYKQLVTFRVQSDQLQQLIDKQTEELAEAKKAPNGEFQRSHIHQINNILFRSGYELDQIHEETRHTLLSCIEELEIDWTRMRSNWVQDEDQIFRLQVILAKCEFLKQGLMGIDTEGTLLPPLTKLTEDIGRFTAAHLSAGTLPDSCLEFISGTIVRLSDVLSAAYDLAVEIPAWRAGLVEPKLGSLSAAGLNEIQTKIKARIADIPPEISQVQRLLPEGGWRLDHDLRPEIYAFAEILQPKSVFASLPVKDLFHYLDNNPESRLRRMQMDKLKNDDSRCKSWLEVREKQELQLNQAVALAREGNYLQAEEFMGQIPQLFSDLNYRLYQDATKPWLDQRDQLRKRLGDQLLDLEKRLQKTLQQPWIPLPRSQLVRHQLAEMRESIEKEFQALEKYAKTDFHRDTRPIFQEIEESFDEIEERAQKRLALCRTFSLAEAVVLAILLGGSAAVYIHSLKITEASLVVEVTPFEQNDSAPDVTLGTYHQHAFLAKFPSLVPGRYALRIDSPGFYSKEASVTLVAGKPEKWGPVELLPISGILRLEPTTAAYDFQARLLNDQGKESDPVKIARDGATNGQVIVGESTVVNLRPGRYRVYFSQRTEGQAEAKKFDVITEITAHQVTSYHPDFNFATLEIKTEPPGATVSLDGKLLGTTPFRQKLAPIHYSLDVSMDNFQSFYAPLRMNPGGYLPLKLVLQPKDRFSTEEGLPVPQLQLDQDQSVRQSDGQ